MPKIKLTKCNPDLVRQTLASLKLDTDGSTRAIVDRLAAYYAENATSLDIAGCDVCGADSDANLDACPFCGEEGVMDEPVTVADKAPAEKVDKAPPKKKAGAKKKASAEKVEVEKKAPPKKKQTPKAKAAAKRREAEAKKKRAETEKKLKAQAKQVKEAEAKAEKERKAKKAPAPSGDGQAGDVVSTTVITVKELDAQVGIIRQCVTDGAMALHRLGTAAKLINDAGLWKMRETKDGESLYRSFKQFCTEDLKMTTQHIYRAIRVAEDFTEDDVRGLSANQIRVVMQLPKDVRDTALAAAKDGESGPKLSARAAALAGDKGTESSPPATKAVTVAIVPGITKVAMYKRGKGTSSKVCDPETATPATSLADKPWLAIELKNNVRLLVRLDQNKDGTLKAAVEFRRGEQVV